MLLYSWERIFRAAKQDPHEAFRIFKMLVNKEVPKNAYDKIHRYYWKNFSGNSFLINPEELLYNASRYSRRNICTYLHLASLRSFAEYRVYGTLTLDLLHSPVDSGQLTDNRLLDVKNGKIHFLYERSHT